MFIYGITPPPKPIPTFMVEEDLKMRLHENNILITPNETIQSGIPIQPLPRADAIV